MSMIQVTMTETSRYCLPAMEIDGSVAWQTESDPERIDVRLIHYTQGKGTQDVVIAGEESWQAPGSSGTREFRFRLPDQPYSFSGKLISLVWAVEAVLQPSRDSAMQTFEMSPGGQEIQLPQVEPTA